jgi:hypothetical protein
VTADLAEIRDADIHFTGGGGSVCVHVAGGSAFIDNVQTFGGGTVGLLVDAGASVSIGENCDFTHCDVPIGINPGGIVSFPQRILLADQGPPGAFLTFLAPNGGSSIAEADVLFPLVSKTTMVRIHVEVATAPGGIHSSVFTVRKNGADTALTATLTGAQTSIDSDLQSIPFAVGDQISVRMNADIDAGNAMTAPRVTIEGY